MTTTLGDLASASVARRLADALHVAVVNATRRMTDERLAKRVLADEGRRIHVESLGRLFSQRWRDEFGLLHCPCGHRLTEPVHARGELHSVPPHACPSCGAVAS